MTQNLDRFKFRWYNPKIQFMADIVSLNVSDNYAIVKYSFADEHTPDEEVNISDGILMQCTGRKDRYGKLIFEGDIVCISVNTNASMKEYRFTIEWDSRRQSFQTRTLEWDYERQAFQIQTSTNEIYEAISFVGASTMIGNIHLNPELL